MPTVFDGSNIDEWADHFQLSTSLRDKLKEQEVNSVEDLEYVFTYEATFEEVVAGISHEEIERFKSTILFTPVLSGLISEERRRLMDERKERIRIARTLVQKQSMVDIVFLVDCTHSMGKYIRGIYRNIDTFVSRIKSKSQELIIRLGFVGYRDHCDESKRLELFGLTENVEEFRSFVSALVAKGGGDIPEDVLGGMNQVCKFIKWGGSHRLLYHIGDAPCHGAEFHSANIHDDYPNGDKNNLTPEGVLRDMNRLQLKYYFLEVRREYTQIMTHKFAKIWESLHPPPSDPMQILPVTELTLMDLVFESALISLSVISMNTQVTYEGLADIRYIPLDPNVPDWNSLETENVLRYDPKDPQSIDDLVKESASACLQKSPVEGTRIQLAEAPFAKGKERLAYFGKVHRPGDEGSPPKRSDVVFKESLARHAASKSRALYEASIHRHRTAKYLAAEFNKVKPSNCPNVEYCDIALYHLTDRQGQERPFLIGEERIKGTFEKFNNNLGLVAPNPTQNETYHDPVQTFCHWTYTATKGMLVVNDCQGEYDHEKNRFLLTDPAICCLNGLLFGETNMMEVGMEQFFKTHMCSVLCESMKLSIPAFGQISSIKTKTKTKARAKTRGMPKEVAEAKAMERMNGSTTPPLEVEELT